MQTGMQTINWLGLSSEKQTSLLARPAMADSSEISNTVAEIIAAIRHQGDSALVNYTKRFDKLDGDNFTVSAQDVAQASARLGTDIKNASTSKLLFLRLSTTARALVISLSL